MYKPVSCGHFLGALVAALAAIAPAFAADAQREATGTVADGLPVEAITLTPRSGISARILTYGATLQSLIVPVRDGQLADVLLGYGDPADYVSHPNYFSVTVGRYANRIAGGRFILDGHTWQLPLNDGANSVHGGTRGFDKVVWKIERVESASVASFVLSRLSIDRDQSYPGMRATRVTYASDDVGELRSSSMSKHRSRRSST